MKTTILVLLIAVLSSSNIAMAFNVTEIMNLYGEMQQLDLEEEQQILEYLAKFVAAGKSYQDLVTEIAMHPTEPEIQSILLLAVQYRIEQDLKYIVHGTEMPSSKKLNDTTIAFLCARRFDKKNPQEIQDIIAQAQTDHERAFTFGLAKRCRCIPHDQSYEDYLRSYKISTKN